MALFHFVLLLHCPTTFISEDLVLDLCFSFKTASLFPGLSYHHFYYPPFRLLVFQGSFLAIALELELPLLWLRKASLIISSRHWVAGRVMPTCYMCTPQWKPSFRLQQSFPSRYWSHLFLRQGCHRSWGIWLPTATNPSFSEPVSSAWRSLTELQRFANHGSSLI